MIALALKAWGLLKSVPREVWYIAAAVLAIWLYGNARYNAGYEKRSAEYAEMAAKAVIQAREADEVARDTVEASKGAVEAGNDRARDAAKDSDDPLADGLRELRR